MCGIVGFVDQQLLEPGRLEALVKPMLHRPTYQVRRTIEGRFGTAVIDLAGGRQTIVTQSQDGRFLLTLYGGLYESWAEDSLSLSQELVNRWLRQGWKGLANLNGEYLILVWDRTELRLTIVNDRLGLKRLHLWSNGSALAWASELKSLAVLPEVSRATDEEALVQLLTFGHLLDDRTLLKQVKLLPPASILTWHGGSYSIHSYWSYTFQADPALEKTDRVIDEYAARVEQAVGRRIKNHRRVGLLLSGGLDSRTLAGMIRRLRPVDALPTWTTGHAHSHDVLYARGIARRIRSFHKTLEVAENFLELFGPTYAWLLDGMVSSHGAHRAVGLEEVAQEVDVLPIGYLGDRLSGGTPLDKVIHLQTVEEIAQKGVQIAAVGFDDASLQRTLRMAVYKRVAGTAQEAWRKSILKAQVEHPADRVVWADLVQRQRLWNPPALLDLIGADCHVATPFADKEFVEFILRLPASQRIGKKAYIGMICREFPHLARVPRSGDGLPLIHSRIRASLHWRWVLFEHHTLPRLTMGRLGGHAYGSYVHCSEWFRTASRRFIEKTLYNNPILGELFDLPMLEVFVQEFLNGASSTDRMECIAALMSFALFREKLEQLPVYQPQKAPLCAAS